MSNTIFSYTNEKGIEFKINGDIEGIRRKVANLIESAEVDEEYVYWNGDERNPTEDDRFKDLIGLTSLLSEEHDWLSLIEKLPKKKNGTFHKGRVQTLYRARSFSQLYEESYGYNAPEIRLKNVSDNESILQYEHIVESW